MGINTSTTNPRMNDQYIQNFLKNMSDAITRFESNKSAPNTEINSRGFTVSQSDNGTITARAGISLTSFDDLTKVLGEWFGQPKEAVERVKDEIDAMNHKFENGISTTFNNFNAGIIVTIPKAALPELKDKITAQQENQQQAVAR
jgi:hypothetical protein